MIKNTLLLLSAGIIVALILTVHDLRKAEKAIWANYEKSATECADYRGQADEQIKGLKLFANMNSAFSNSVMATGRKMEDRYKLREDSLMIVAIHSQKQVHECILLLTQYKDRLESCRHEEKEMIEHLMRPNDHSPIPLIPDTSIITPSSIPRSGT